RACAALRAVPTRRSSDLVGQEVMRAAAAHVHPVVLELGGKSPNIVLDDADTDAAAAGILGGFVKNAGQACNAGTRLIATPGAYEDRKSTRLNSSHVKISY